MNSLVWFVYIVVVHLSRAAVFDFDELRSAVYNLDIIGKPILWPADDDDAVRLLQNPDKPAVVLSNPDSEVNPKTDDRLDDTASVLNEVFSGATAMQEAITASVPDSANQFDPKSYSDHVMMGNMDGQQFFCGIAEYTSLAKLKKLSNSTIPKTPSVVESVALISKYSPCLRHTKGWWTYEVCFGKEVKQFHVEGHVISGQIISLGLFDTDFDWDTASQADVDIHWSNKVRFHSQIYENGTKCDLNDNGRGTEVRLFCDNGRINPVIQRVDEPASCQYIITILSKSFCTQPGFIDEAVNKPLAIECRPTLDSVRFDQYRRIEESRIKLEALQKPKKAKMSLPMIQKHAMFGANRPVTNEDMTELVNKMTETFKGLGVDVHKLGLMHHFFPDEFYATDSLNSQYETYKKVMLEGKLEIINHVEDDEQFIRVGGLGDDDDEDVTFDKEFAQLKSRQKTIAHSSEQHIRRQLNNEFSDIVNEAKQELVDAGEKIDSKVETEVLKKEFDKSIDQIFDKVTDANKRDDASKKSKLTAETRKKQLAAAQNRVTRLEETMSSRIKQLTFDQKGHAVDVKIKIVNPTLILNRGDLDDEEADAHYESDEFINALLTALTTDSAAQAEQTRYNKAKQAYQWMLPEEPKSVKGIEEMTRSTKEIDEKVIEKIKIDKEIKRTTITRFIQVYDVTSETSTSNEQLVESRKEQEVKKKIDP